jgi:hypothetical protein
MNLATPLSVQKLQQALHDKAKGSPSFRFYALYDKVYRKDVLAHAYQCCRANGGAAGVDGQSFKDIEEYGVERWLDELTQELKGRTYRPQPVRRVYIPKPDGKQRPFGVPTASANCTGAQIAFRMGGDLPSVPSAPRPALSNLERAPNSRHRYLPTPRSGSRHVQHCARLDRPGRSFSVRLAGFATAAVRC